MTDALGRASGSLISSPFLHSRSQLLPRLFYVVWILAFVVGPVRGALATVSEIDLGSPGTLAIHRKFSFDQLNNTQLVGQSLSLDFTFSDNEFVRLFSITSTLFSTDIKLGTNGSGDVGTLHGTGYLIDQNGEPIPGFGITGEASGNGAINLGLFPLLEDENGTPNNNLPRPLDFFGVHFDLMLPDIEEPWLHITNGQFGLFSQHDTPFGIGPGLPRDIVPDSASSLILLIIAVGFLITAKVHYLRRVP